MRFKVLALGNEEVTSWVANSLIAHGIEVVRLFEVPETITVLKQDKFDMAVVDSGMEDLENVCFRLIWICRMRVALISRNPEGDWANLSPMGIDAVFSQNSGQSELAFDIEAIARKGNHQFNNIKVLVIEDDRHIREAIRLCFRIFWPEAEVNFADEGQAGVNYAKTKPQDIILLDLGLPDISGFEALNWIRNFSQTPVIILTATRDKEHVTRAIQSGANDYVVKPFKQIELMPRIRKYVLQGINRN